MKPTYKKDHKQIGPVVVKYKHGKSMTTAGPPAALTQICLILYERLGSLARLTTYIFERSSKGHQCPGWPLSRLTSHYSLVCLHGRQISVGFVNVAPTIEEAELQLSYPLIDPRPAGLFNHTRSAGRGGSDSAPV